MILLFQDITTPPGEFNAFLLWVIGILVFAIGFLVTTFLNSQKEIKKVYDSRLADKDEVIKQLILDRNDEKEQNKKLANEFKNALESSNRIADSVLNILNKQ